jgi:hypothetical protein
VVKVAMELQTTLHGELPQALEKTFQEFVGMLVVVVVV